MITSLIVDLEGIRCFFSGRFMSLLASSVYSLSPISSLNWVFSHSLYSRADLRPGVSVSLLMMAGGRVCGLFSWTLFVVYVTVGRFGAAPYDIGCLNPNRKPVDW